MGPSVMIDMVAPTHELIKIRDPNALTADVPMPGFAQKMGQTPDELRSCIDRAPCGGGQSHFLCKAPIPAWAQAAIERTPWVVVRRGHIQHGMIPVGIRGSIRSQRFAGWLSESDILAHRRPEDLWDNVNNCPKPGLVETITHSRVQAVPALATLTRISPILSGYGYQWGPGGSVGFELATDFATTTSSSDLDIILRQPCRLELDQARSLHTELVEAAKPTRIDVLLETPFGGVSLAELVTESTWILVRTPDGPRLSRDPWTECTWMDQAS